MKGHDPVPLRVGDALRMEDAGPMPLGKIVAQVRERFADTEPIEADTVEPPEDAAERLNRQREARESLWRSRLPRRYANASLRALRDQQSPSQLAVWLAAEVGVTDRALNLLLAGPSRRGKCLTGDSLVTDPDTGLPWRLVDVVGDYTVSRVASYDGKQISVENITQRIDSGVQPTLRMILNSGREITVTRHHPLLLPDGWRAAADVRPGETVALPARLPEPRKPERMSAAEIDLLAILVAEGCCGPGGGTTGRTVSFSTADPVLLARAESAAGELGMTVKHLGRYDYALRGCVNLAAPPGACGCGCGEPVPPAARTDRRAGAVKGQPRRYIHGHGARQGVARSFVRKYGIECGARDKRMPEAVYRLDNDGVARFLTVLWACDGTVGSDGRPDFTVASEPLARAVQHLLVRLGVQSRLSWRPGVNAWRLVVRADSRAAFAEALALWGLKAQRAALPTGGFTRTGQPVTTRVMNLALTASPHLWWDRVERVEDAGERRVYDLSVESTGCFVANDVIVHNTYAAYALGNAYVGSGGNAVAWSLADLNAALRPDGDDTAYDRVTSVALLVLDDVGREQVSAWTLEQLQRILDHRNREGLRTVFTTNLDRAGLTERYGEPIVARMLDDCQVIRVNGEPIDGGETTW